MSGQAEQAPDDTLAGLADYLAGEPETAPEDEQEEAATTQTEEDTEEVAEGTDDDEAEQDESEDAKDQQPGKTFKVTVKGEDGADVEQDVDEAELIRGYQRQADYTRKTQDLAKRESEATNMLMSKHQEMRDSYLQRAELGKAAVLQLAGLKSPQEMQALAEHDPAAAVAEEYRQRQVWQLINQIDAEIAAERQQQQGVYQQSLEQAKASAWEKLSHEGISKEGLAKVYKDAVDRYGVSQQSLGNLYDPGIVLMMRDALAYRELKNKVPEATRKAQSAPKLPSKQAQQNTDRKARVLTEKFRTGKAKLNDLAAFLT